MKNYEMLSNDLKNFDELEDDAKESVADYIACPSCDGCRYDGEDNSCCVDCKIKWLESEVD